MERDLRRAMPLTAYWRILVSPKGGSTLFAHRRQQGPELPSVALQHRLDLRMVAQDHADIIDGDVLDLIKPVDATELKVQFVPRTLWRNDLAGHENNPVRFGSTAGHAEFAAANLCKAPTVGEHDVFFQERSELLLLLRARGAPMGAKNKTRHPIQIEILAQHLTEIGQFLIQGRSRAHLGERVVPDRADEHRRGLVGRRGKRWSRCACDHPKGESEG